MANIKASELERDKLVEGNELIVSTDGDGKTRNILSGDLAEFAAKKAEDKLAPSVQANTDKITEIKLENANIVAKNQEIEAKNAELDAKSKVLEASDEKLAAKDVELEKADAALAAKDIEIEGKVEGISTKVTGLDSKIQELEEKAEDTSVTDDLKSQINALESKHDTEIDEVNNTVNTVKTSVEDLQTKHNEDIEKLLAAHDNPWEEFGIVGNKG